MGGFIGTAVSNPYWCSEVRIFFIAGFSTTFSEFLQQQ
jgi:hypothetical protein